MQEIKFIPSHSSDFYPIPTGFRLRIYLFEVIKPHPHNPSDSMWKISDIYFSTNSCLLSWSFMASRNTRYYWVEAHLFLHQLSIVWLFWNPMIVITLWSSRPHETEWSGHHPCLFFVLVSSHPTSCLCAFIRICGYCCSIWSF